MESVYVSSTFEDLKDYRANVNQALRSAGFQLVAMEDYAAFDERPVVRCLADVANCNFYVGILAHRYGYIPEENNPERLSITEQEYREAGKAGIQRLMFLLDPEAAWPPMFLDRHMGTQIERFRQEVEKQHGRSIFRGPDDLAKKVLAALSAKNAERTTNDVASGKTGLEVFTRLLKSDARIADAVSRSRQVLEDIHRQLSRLELFKLIHDAFHQIEVRCLALMQPGRSLGMFRVVKATFRAQTRNIEAALQDPSLDPGLREEIEVGLQSVTHVLRTHDDDSWTTAFEQVRGELQHLLSIVPASIDGKINMAARELKLDSLITLMTKVRDVMINEASKHEFSAHATVVEQLDRAIGAYKRLGEDLAQRVTEHSRLQNLDRELRFLINSDTAPRTLASDWDRIKRVRSKLVAPFSQQLQEFVPELLELDSKIEENLSKDDQQAFDFLKGYFELLRTAFLDVDAGLMNFSGELGKMGRPLKDITDILETC